MSPVHLVAFLIASQVAALTITQDPILFKTVQRAKQSPRLVFFAGVEGSGHHLLDSITSLMPKTRLIRTLASWNCVKIWKHEDVDSVADRFKGLDTDYVYVYGEDFSYPMCGIGSVKHRSPADHAHRTRMTIAHPQAEWLKEATDKAGGRLQVILLHRNLEDALASGCERRAEWDGRFESCPDQVETLISNVDILLNQIKNLGSSHQLCFQYGNAESMASSLREAFGTEADGLVEQVYNEKHATSENNRNNDPEWKEYVFKMRGAQAKLDAACNIKEKVSLTSIVQFTQV